MMKHAGSETDMASLASSSSSSPLYLKHTHYTVESPFTQSQDGDKSSVRSSIPVVPTYTVQSPSTDQSQDGDNQSPYTGIGIASSPSRPSSTLLSSSGSRISGTRRNWNWNHRHEKGWNQCYVIVEEEEEEEEEWNVRWQWLVGVVLVFGLVCLIIWGVTKPYKHSVAVESLAVNNFYFGEGSDYTGVPTKLITVNCTMNITIRNTAAYFGIHVSSTPVDLSYLDVTVATGQIKTYYQQRKSQQILSLNLEGNKIPLYGAGSSLAEAFVKEGVPLRLSFDICSRADVVGRLVMSKHRKRISCIVYISSRNTGIIRFKKNSCRYR